jgi:hypothetical protein
MLLISVDWLPPYFCPYGRLPASTIEDLVKPHSVVEGCAQPGLGPFPEPRSIDYLIMILGSLLHLPCDGPHECDQFSGDSSRGDIGVFTSSCEPAVALTEPHLGFPGYVADLIG